MNKIQEQGNEQEKPYKILGFWHFGMNHHTQI
jgi:hypothetical protein